MGRYCACGVKYKGLEVDCECKWNGWHNLFDSESQAPANENDLPTIDGKYVVRINEHGDQWEDESLYETTPKLWDNGSTVPSHWSEDYEDNYLGWRKVYAWRDSE